MTPEDALNAVLDRCPTDWQARRVLADWYEEQGDLDAARFQRWLAEEQRSPWQGDNRHPEGPGGWWWFSYTQPSRILSSAALGMWLWLKLWRGGNRPSSRRQDAEGRLREVLEGLGYRLEEALPRLSASASEASER